MRNGPRRTPRAAGVGAAEDGQRAAPWSLVAALSIGGLVFSIAQSAVFPAFPQMQRTFDTSVSGVTWSATSFQVMAAVSTGLLGRLGDMFGKRRMLLVVLCVYGAGGLVAALAPSIGVVIAGRLVMGLGGAIYPLSFSVARDELPGRHLPWGIGMISATSGLGIGFGLVLGGVIVDHASFRWVFGFSVIGAVVAIGLVAFALPPSRVRTPARLDLFGSALLCVGLAAPLIGISQASHAGWTSRQTLLLVAAGVVVLAAFGVFELRHPAPVFHVPTFLIREVLYTNLTVLLAGFAFYAGAFFLIVQFAQVPTSTGYGFGLDATHAGFLLVPGSAGMLVAAARADRLIASFGARGTMLLGNAVSAAGCLALAVDHSRLAGFAIWSTLTFVGIGLIQAAGPVLVLDAVSATRSSEAAGVNTVIRYIGASLGTQVVASVLAASAAGAGGRTPTEDGYVRSFLLVTAVGLVATALASRIPVRRRTADAAAPLPAAR